MNMNESHLLFSTNASYNVFQTDNDTDIVRDITDGLMKVGAGDSVSVTNTTDAVGSLDTADFMSFNGQPRSNGAGDQNVVAFTLLAMVVLVLFLAFGAIYAMRRRRYLAANSGMPAPSYSWDTYADDVEDWERHLLEDGAVYRPTTSEPIPAKLPKDNRQNKQLRLELEGGSGLSGLHPSTTALT